MALKKFWMGKYDHLPCLLWCVGSIEDVIAKAENGILRRGKMSQMNVQIVTPDGLVYDHHAAFVSVRRLMVN